MVAGGSGFIGSHTILELLEQDAHVVVVDNLSNSKEESLKRVGDITGKADHIIFAQVDLQHKDKLHSVFRTHGPFDAVIHFAGLKAVGESVSKPLKYYTNNLVGTFMLLECMQEFDCKRLIFSSSATVYGNAPVPITEQSPVGSGITNPYGQTKFMIEQVLRDVYVSDPSWSIVLLRYFNPVGAHISGRIGESPDGIPNNLMPFVQQVAVGKRPFVSVFGNDYDTVDGTGVRDYIHVVDLAQGHLAALRWIDSHPNKCEVFNLGTGKGTSVLEMVRAMEKASGNEVPVKIVSRRAGDLAIVYADTTKAREELGWVATRNIEDTCRDAWKWQSTNPDGYI